ncbi:MAG: 4-(cytidine 5'-diphospho)-2-C-methyl-D-erythritol kinase [Selenomonadaceae bacterium]|nr:4-(cytidine 5'-diphospho)-2-C-methyl-D-erythritol kinase [Selenomonadaceae bacterium]
MIREMIMELARAKINLTLDILKLREDGYHEVEMIMQTIGLADEVELTRIKSGIAFTMDTTQILGGENIPADERNLAYRAVLAMQEYCKRDFGVKVHLIKKIPAAAGLGGGSADAAAVIRGMNWLYDLNLNINELCLIGEKIGSDVPFCVVEGTFLAKGRGEILRELAPFKNYAVILLKPNFEIATAWAYKTFDTLDAAKIQHPQTYKIIEMFRMRDFDTVFKYFANVLEPVAEKVFPDLESYKVKLIKAGAKVALMSGSGPTIFALADKADVDRIVASVQDLPAQIFITETD